MSILKNQIKSTLGLKGVKPAAMSGAKAGSTLHNTSSLNGIPVIAKPASKLDLDGKTPKKYLDSKPR
jgi:hypothetical protein